MSTTTHQLLALFAEEVALLRQLLLILDRESEALLGPDAVALESVTAEKNSALARQGELEHRRNQLATALQCELENEQASGGEDRAKLRQYHRELADVAAQCHERNRANGRLIAQRQQQTRDALGILMQSGEDSVTYSDRGGERSGSASRLLGKA